MRSLLFYPVSCLCAVLAFTGMCLPGKAEADSLPPYSEKNYSAQKEDKEKARYLSEANSRALAYLAQARAFREAGRYELARQRYLQSLSICADEQTIYILTRELSGVELLLRTMR